MATTPLELAPPDDTGSDTLQRYRYQAQLVVPFCLDCLVNGQIKSILVEHFEDVLIEYQDRWQFIQVKTRNANLGPWKLATAMDGLGSLWRTHESIKQSNGLNVGYALFLEGAIAKDDLLNELAQSEFRNTREIHPEVLERVIKELGITEWECKKFLTAMTVLPNQPTRQDVSARNMRLLGQMATTATDPEIQETYRKLVNRILEAMAAEKLESEIPSYVSNPNLILTSSRKIEKKRLTRAMIQNILGSLAFGPSLLLQRVTNLNIPSPTNLESKLLAAGADSDVLDDVKMLRANASMREVEILASSYDDTQLEDIQNRLTIIAKSIIQKHTQKRKPFVHAYPELITALRESAAICDPNRLFRQDPFFLMGEVCILSDECKIEWGTTNA